MHQPDLDDPDLVADAVAYLAELWDEREAQVGPGGVGAGKRTLELVLGDPVLCADVRRWARRRRSCEMTVGRILPLPVDAAYRRVRAALHSGAHQVERV
jgi:hypothetical protein